MHGNHTYSGVYTIRLITRSLHGNMVNWGYYIYPQPHLPPFTPAVHGNYRTAIDREKPTICYQMRAFRALRISLDFKVVPEAGLEPAQAFTRGILSAMQGSWQN